MKRLVVCLDGTWNTPDDEGRATNVVKIMRAVAHRGSDGVDQITFYDKGVGTGGPLDRIRGGALGRGLDDNVRDGYRFLGNNYSPGDEIYLFGFSRGAFTARSLAGLIGACGLLDKSRLGSLMRAWELYRTPPEKREEAGRRAIRDLADTTVRIKCIGVWDTVGALGVPIKTLNRFSQAKYKFHDTELGDIVERAFHALAVDEKRGPFAPTLWQTRKTPAPDGQIVEQVWFPGVHSDVGGGYANPEGYQEHRLSDLALDWMIKRVGAKTKLAFDRTYLATEIRPSALALMHESRSAAYTFSKGFPYQRVIGEVADWVRKFPFPRHNTPEAGEHFVNEMIHQSVLERFGQSAPLQKGEKTVEEDYRPESVAAAKDGLAIVGHDGEPVSLSAIAAGASLGL